MIVIAVIAASPMLLVLWWSVVGLVARAIGGEP